MDTSCQQDTSTGSALSQRAAFKRSQIGNKLIMWFWRLLGILLLGIGAVGIVLPVLPTTIFWILAALCFARSDPKIRDWIYARPGVGPQVELFIEKGAMTRAGKRGALIGMSLAAALVTFLFYSRPIILAAGLGFIAIGALVVLTRATGEVSASADTQA